MVSPSKTSSPGKPAPNAFADSVNDQRCGALLDQTLFPSIRHTRDLLPEWRTDDPSSRPQSSLRWLAQTDAAAHIDHRCTIDRPGDQGPNKGSIPGQAG